MKKSLLFAAAACLSMSAMAAPQMMKHQQKSQLEKQLDAQLFTKDFAKQNLNATKINKAKAAEGPVMGAFPGTPGIYNLAGYIEGYLDYDIPALAQVEDDVVYFENLLPGYLTETAIISATREGDNISIPFQKIYNNFFLWDYYICDVYVCLLDPQTGYPVTDADYPLVLMEDGTIANLDESFLGLYVDVSAYGYEGLQCISYNVAFQLTPVEYDAPAELPAGAEPEEYVYSYELEDIHYASKEHVYVDGADIYMDGLTAGYGVWVKGTIEGDKVIVPSGQFLGTTPSYLLTLEAISNLVLDDDGSFVDYDVLPALTFTITEDGYVLDEGQMVGLQYATGKQLAYYMNNLTVTKFMGDVIAKPVTPIFAEYAGYLGDYDQYAMSLYFPNVGTKGEFLSYENMEWAILTDGCVYTFYPEDGYYLSEEMEWFPAASFADDESYDIFGADGVFTVYLYSGLFNEIGLQSRNTVDGVTMYSDIRYINVDTNEERVEEVENEDPVSLNAVQAAKVANLFDLQGRRADKTAKGLVIRNGQVNFIK